MTAIGLIAGAIVGIGGTVAVAAVTNTVRASVINTTDWCVEARSTMNTNLATPTGYGYSWSMTSACGTTKSVQNVGSLGSSVNTFRNNVLCGTGSITYNTSAPAANVTSGIARNCGTGNYKAQAQGWLLLSAWNRGATAYTPNAAF